MLSRGKSGNASRTQTDVTDQIRKKEPQSSARKKAGITDRTAAAAHFVLIQCNGNIVSLDPTANAVT
jgi:hypothetical protein